MNSSIKCIICGNHLATQNKDLVILGKRICRACEKGILLLTASDKEYSEVIQRLKVLIS